MFNQILPPELFSKGAGNVWKVRVERFGVTRAFAGCTDNINVWAEISIDAVTVYASAKPSTDVFVIMEQGVQ